MKDRYYIEMCPSQSLHDRFYEYADEHFPGNRAGAFDYLLLMALDTLAPIAQATEPEIEEVVILDEKG